MKLIVKLNDYWGIYEVNGDLIILPNKKPLCNAIYGDEVCYGELLIHDFRCYRHTISPPLIHCDVHLKCMKCGAHYTRGLAIPPEMFEKIRKSRFHGKTLRLELKEIYGDELPKSVLERLERWGYW